MEKLNNYSLQCDLYNILEAGVLLQCKEVDNNHFMEWIVKEKPLHKVLYSYSSRKLMMEDHYKISSFYFKLKYWDGWIGSTCL